MHTEKYMSRVRDNNDDKKEYIYMVRETLKSTCSCILQLHVYSKIYVNKNHTLAKAMINVYNIFTVCVQTDTVLIMLARVSI